MAKIQNMLMTEWFWAMMQFIVIAATLILIYIQVKIQTAAHVVQALSTIHNRWNSEAMLRARLKVCSDWSNGKKAFDGVDQFVAEFIEELGIYVKTGAIPANAMWEAQSWYVEHYYCMFKDRIDHVRTFYKDINLYTQFESLYKKMDEINRKNSSPAFIRDDDELRRFAVSEVQLSKAFLQLREDTSELQLTSYPDDKRA